MIDQALSRLLFRMEPERAHATALRLLRFAAAAPLGEALLKRRYAPPDQPVTVCGLRFRNRIGLAAGYDKDGSCIHGLSALGFGHLELGTVTPVAQPGNPKPRIHRFREAGALINSMGFPSRGAEALAANLGHRPPGVVIGVNIGRNKTTPNEEAARDYEFLARRFSPLADYLTANISSPNTPGLRALEERSSLERLIHTLRTTIDATQRVPLWLKVSPDSPALHEVIEIAREGGVDAIVATNTTTSRRGLTNHADLPGGLSGRPLAGSALSTVTRIKQVAPDLPVVAVGGITTVEDARRCFDAGADLIQVYTSLVYVGPNLVRNLASA